MKNYIEEINEMKNTINLDIEGNQEQYIKAESDLVNLFSDCIKGMEVSSTSLGTGTITDIYGTTVEDLIAEVSFSDEIKKFLIKPIMVNTANNKGFIRLKDGTEICDIWNSVYDLHTDLTRQHKDIEYTKKQNKKEEEKKAEAAKKAEEKYQKTKERIIKDFEDRTNQAKADLNTTDEFYYALGWLTKHVGAVSATLPDYLAPSFESYFGVDAPKTLIDGRSKTSGGHAMQWGWSFKCNLKKLDNTAIPTYLKPMTNDSAKSISNTAFIWDLVDNYGFQFGKKQDVDKIKDHIPNQFIQSFEEGLTA